MRPGEDPDVQLMLAVKAGDSAAFKELYGKYARQIVRYAMQFVQSQSRAEELAQDVFLQVYRARKSYEPRARFTTWLYRIATNTCLTEVRRPEHRVRMEPLGGTDPDDESERAGELADPRIADGEATAIASQVKERMQALLEGLPPQQKAALLLARVEGFSYEEIAESLSCSVSAVKSLVHRATVAMRDGLGDILGTEAT